MKKPTKVKAIKNTEAQKRARKNYDMRMREKGFKKCTIWLPAEDIDGLRGGTPIQGFVENLVENLVRKAP
jgi:hypothetical protein